MTPRRGTLPSTFYVSVLWTQHAPSFQVFEATDEALKEEDAAKERLCSELNMLVQQSAHAQLEKLEQVHLLSSHIHFWPAAMKPEGELPPHVC